MSYVYKSDMPAWEALTKLLTFHKQDLFTHGLDAINRTPEGGEEVSPAQALADALYAQLKKANFGCQTGNVAEMLTEVIHFFGDENDQSIVIPDPRESSHGSTSVPADIEGYWSVKGTACWVDFSESPDRSGVHFSRAFENSGTPRNAGFGNLYNGSDFHETLFDEPFITRAVTPEELEAYFVTKRTEDDLYIRIEHSSFRPWAQRNLEAINTFLGANA